MDTYNGRPPVSIVTGSTGNFYRINLLLKQDRYYRLNSTTGYCSHTGLYQQHQHAAA